MRIVLSQGELTRQNGDLHGEALQLALEANALADAGEVVLTDAVYLSMAKSEAATEVIGERPLPGGGRIRLRRALRGENPLAPYGGRALSRLGRLSDPMRSVRLRVAAERAFRITRKKTAWAAAALLLVAAAAGERSVPRDPVERAAGLLQARQPLAALAELDHLADTPQSNTPGVAVLRGKAEHALGRAGLAFSDFAAAAQTDPSALDDLEAETFPALWRPAVVRLLGEKVGRRAALSVRRLLNSPRASARDDALKVLELAGAASDGDRLAVATAELSDPHASCSMRIEAIRRLALVIGPKADSLLQKAASEKACGVPQARDALRRRSRLAQAY